MTPLPNTKSPALTDADIAVHTKLSITLEMLERARLRRVDDSEASDLLALRHPRLGGILYPYINPITDAVATYRVRRDHPDMESGKPKNKYIEAYGNQSRLYFPPDSKALLNDPNVDIVIVEAEKSVLAVTCAAERVGRRVLVIGTGGCWRWRGRIGKTEDETGARVDEKGPLPDWGWLTLKDRKVTIAFDSNAATKATPQTARRALIRYLVGEGAKTSFIDLPADAGINGPDDFIGRHGDDAFFDLIYKKTTGLDPDYLADAADVIAEGQAIAERGVSYLVDGLVQNYGMVGMQVARAKVGKTTLAQLMGAAVAKGEAFLGRATTQARVLIIASEDPPEYTAYLAKQLSMPRGLMTFYRKRVLLNAEGLADVAKEIEKGGYGLVLIATWQAVIRSLLDNENDNAGACRVVEEVKAVARQTKIPWLIDAHAGKGEDQKDDADPMLSLRGASAAAGAADFILWLRYADGAFGNTRKLSGKGRFVSEEPQTISYDHATGTYKSLGKTKDKSSEDAWDTIVRTGALTNVPRSAKQIALAAGIVSETKGTATSTCQEKVRRALKDRDGVVRTEETHRGQKTTLYHVVGAFHQGSL